MTFLPGLDPFPSDPAARIVASSAWYTPPEAAADVARMCWTPGLARNNWRVLEPSAGDGSLLSALVREMGAGFGPKAPVDAVELDATAADKLRARAVTEAWDWPINVDVADYLSRPAPAEPYDLCLANPPYERGTDSAFISKAMDESLRVVALVRLALLESQRSHERIWSRIKPGGWRLLALCPYISRPVFLPGGGESDGGKTAFMLIKLSRVEPPEDSAYQAGLTSVRWR
jgi:predicted RNA methylase